MVVKRIKWDVSKDLQDEKIRLNKNSVSFSRTNIKQQREKKNLVNKIDIQIIDQYQQHCNSNNVDALNDSNFQIVPEINLVLYGPSLCPPTNLPSTMSVKKRVMQVQKYLNSLQYDIHDKRNIKVKKTRPLCGLMECAKEIMNLSQPIKCMEAVILGLYLTNSCEDLDRFPVSFRTRHQGLVHRHVILAIHHQSLFGAIGLSRKTNLMYKSLKFLSLADLLEDFLKSYQENDHDVLRIKIGAVVTHDPHTYETICWNTSLINCSDLNTEDLKKEINQWERRVGKKSSTWHMSLTNLTAQIRDKLLQKSIKRKSRKILPLDKNVVENSIKRCIKMSKVETSKTQGLMAQTLSLPLLF